MTSTNRSVLLTHTEIHTHTHTFCGVSNDATLEVHVLGTNHNSTVTSFRCE